MPEFTVPHSVFYDTPGPVPLEDVVESLLGTQSALNEVGDLLEGCLDGLRVEKVSVAVRSLSQASPLRELFFVTLVVSYQSDLSKEVPEVLEKLLGVEVGGDYDTIITVSLLTVLFYGADYVYRKFREAPESSHIAAQLNGLIADLAAETGKSEDAIRAVLRDKYDPQRMRRMGRAALRFFRPSKRQNSAMVQVGTRMIPREVVSEIPGDVAEDALEPEETSEPYMDVEIELHAQDRDRAKTGWAAIIPAVAIDRVKMKIFSPISPEDIWNKQSIRGDVIAVFRKDNGDYKPVQYHLIRLT